MNGPARGRGCNESRRVFLALPLPEAARRDLARRSRSVLEAHAPHLRLVDPSGYHATVHFFGPLAAADLLRAEALCGRVVEALAAPLRCALAGLVQLPPRGPARVVCAEFCEGRATLAAFLAEARERIAAAAFPVPARRPLPHVTVARVRRGRRWRMAGPVAFAAALPAAGQTVPGSAARPAAPAPFLLDRLVLFESHLHPAGARYVPLATRRPAAG